MTAVGSAVTLQVSDVDKDLEPYRLWGLGLTPLPPGVCSITAFSSVGTLGSSRSTISGWTTKGRPEPIACRDQQRGARSELSSTAGWPGLPRFAAA
jgi:hypothetical protein